jgi:hypothetical protein
MKGIIFILIGLMFISFLFGIGYIMDGNIKELKEKELQTLDDVYDFLEECEEIVIADCEIILMNKLKDLEKNKSAYDFEENIINQGVSDEEIGYVYSICTNGDALGFNLLDSTYEHCNNNSCQMNIGTGSCFHKFFINKPNCFCIITSTTRDNQIKLIIPVENESCTAAFNQVFPKGESIEPSIYYKLEFEYSCND